MSELIINRRHVGAGMAALAAGVATAQPDERPKLPPPEAFGDLHTKMVDGVVRTAGRNENTLDSPPGLRKLIAYLVEYKVLTRDEANAINEAIAELDAVVNRKKPLSAALDRISAIADKVGKTAGAMAKGVMSILVASVKYASNLGAKLTDGEKANIVLKDLSGCMAGGVAALLAGHPELVLLAVLFTAGGLSAAAVGDALATKK
ncbi:hypothetical protein [Paucibacter sp. XJ19-41]|uniref:hypothetical protein n=1 Tax=Paucibacter sp. XJ19-41 TaxID=2927824 RepID=UPI00234943C8|nr:hypothetical protein [Paucibacter sp. XJ19-41]MDC6167779.1 hypothetical protein [Paucibacter sp. XJ19-41]